MLTVSDGVDAGTRTDESGDALVTSLVDSGVAVVERSVVPDEIGAIGEALLEAVSHADLVLTTGGTGFGPRDVTPEATARLIERPAPGLVHLMLASGLEHTARAALSRPVAGTVGRTLVVNLPGSPSGAIENLASIMPVLPHALQLLAGDTEHQG